MLSAPLRDLTSKLLFRVPRSSFAWAGKFSCHRIFRPWQLRLSHASGTKALSGIRAGWPILNFAPFAKFRVGTLSGPPRDLTSKLLFRVPRSSFAWAGKFSCHRIFRPWQLRLSHASGTKAPSGIRVGWPILNFAPFAKFRVGTLSGPPRDLTSKLLFRVPRSSFAWAGKFSCHRIFRPWQLRLSHALGTKALSGIRAG